MSIKLFCDKCDTEIKKDQFRWKFQRIYLCNAKDFDFEVDSEFWLCKECTDKLDLFLKGV